MQHTALAPPGSSHGSRGWAQCSDLASSCAASCSSHSPLCCLLLCCPEPRCQVASMGRLLWEHAALQSGTYPCPWGMLEDFYLTASATSFAAYMSRLAGLYATWQRPLSSTACMPGCPHACTSGRSGKPGQHQARRGLGQPANWAQVRASRDDASRGSSTPRGATSTLRQRLLQASSSTRQQPAPAASAANKLPTVQELLQVVDSPLHQQTVGAHGWTRWHVIPCPGHGVQLRQ